MPNKPIKGDNLRKLYRSDAMLEVKSHPSPANTVTISAGAWWYKGNSKLVEYAGGVSPIISSPQSGSEIVLLSMSSLGEVSITRGQNPECPKDRLPLAFIFISSTDTVITSDMIFDARPVFSSGSPSISHKDITDRISPDAHNIASITGLQDSLDSKVDNTTFESILTNKLSTKADVDGTTSSTFTLNTDKTGSSPEEAGLYINRGSKPKVGFRFNNDKSKWEFTNDGNIWIDIANVISNISIGSDTVSGLVKLSTPATDSLNPIAVSVTDPRLLTTAEKNTFVQHLGLTHDDPHGTLGLLNSKNIPTHTHSSDEGGALGQNSVSTLQIQNSSVTFEKLSNEVQNKFVNKDINNTINAVHHFEPRNPNPPFTLGTTAEGQLVSGLNADLLDGKHSGDFRPSNWTPNLYDLPEKSYNDLSDKPSHSEIYQDQPELHRPIDDSTVAVDKTWSSAKTSDFITSKVNSIVNGAGSALDTLKELADAIGDNPSFAANVTTQISNKISKVPTATTGNIAIFSSDGGVSDSGQVFANFEPRNLNIQSHINTKGNLHGMVASDLNLGNLENALQLKAVDLLPNNIIDDPTKVASGRSVYNYASPINHNHNTLYEAKNPALTAHLLDLNNPHGTDKVKVGLGNVINALQLKAVDLTQTIVSDDTLIASAGAVFRFASPVNHDHNSLYEAKNPLLVSHATTKGNAHDMTAVDLNLGNLTNDLQLKASQLELTVSTSNTKVPSSGAVKAYAATLNHNHDTIYEPKNPALVAHISDTDNPHGTDKVKVGLGNLTNDLQVKASDVINTINSSTNSSTQVVTAPAVKAYASALGHTHSYSELSGKPNLYQGGITASRPTTPIQFQSYFDSTIGKPIWYTGSVWVDSTGTTV